MNIADAKLQISDFYLNVSLSSFISTAGDIRSYSMLYIASSIGMLT